MDDGLLNYLMHRTVKIEVYCINFEEPILLAEGNIPLIDLVDKNVSETTSHVIKSDV